MTDKITKEKIEADKAVYAGVADAYNFYVAAAYAAGDEDATYDSFVAVDTNDTLTKLKEEKND